MTAPEVDLATCRHPSAFAGDQLHGVLGMSEYEEAVARILRYLADDAQSLLLVPWCDWPALYVRGWRKLFRIATFATISPTLFAMLCAAGWISANYYPKGTFRVSNELIARLHEARP